MSKFYERLYEASEIDLNAVKTLNDNNLYAPAIYHCAQSTEKASKSVLAYYLMIFKQKSEIAVENLVRKSYGHNLKESTKSILDTLMSLYVDNEVKIKPHLLAKKDEARKQLDNTMAQIGNPILNYSRIIFEFDQIAHHMYENIYQNFNASTTTTVDPRYSLLQEGYKDPNTRFVKYIGIVWILALLLDKMEMLSRYPSSEFLYNNISILMKSQKNIKRGISDLMEMLSELISLVPVTWQQIDIYKKNILS